MEENIEKKLIKFLNDKYNLDINFLEIQPTNEQFKGDITIIIFPLFKFFKKQMDKVSAEIVLKYYIYSVPYFISIGLPMAVLISTVFSLGSMVKRNEWTAMKASGISLYRVATPLIVCGFLLSGISFLLDNNLVSYGNEKRFEIDRDYVKRKSRHKLKNTLKDIFLQKNSSSHISLSKYQIQKLSLIHI